MEPLKHKLIANKERILTLFFWSFVMAVVTMRVLLFRSINLDCIDSDQPFMWIGAHDYSQGHFYEPRFYGQNYNTFMEGLFAVPFLWCGMPVYYAVPVATHIIFLFPFLFPALWLFFKGRKQNALMLLAVLLCMTGAYDILNSLPRGFVTGMFFTGFYVLSLDSPRRAGFTLLNMVMSVIGYYVNPNSLLVSLPILFYLFLHNYRSRSFYIASGISLILFAALNHFVDGFYKTHESYGVYNFEHRFSASYFLDNILHPGRVFAHVGFFTEGHALPLMGVLVVLGVLIFRADKKLFYAFLVFLTALLASFFSAKTADGSYWPFYSYSRMYLGVPVMIGLLLSVTALNKKWLLVPAVLLATSFGGYKFYNFSNKVAYHTQQKLWIGVHLVTLKQATDAMDFYRSVCLQNGVDYFLISNGFWLNTFLDYGGPAVYKDFPQTQETNSERRYWVREGNRNKVFNRFIFLSRCYTLDKFMPPNPGFQIRRLDDYGLNMIENNTLTNNAFIKYVMKYEYQD